MAGSIATLNMSATGSDLHPEHHKDCLNGLFLPIFMEEARWNQGFRALLYLVGLLYCFMGVAIVADIFMGAIEVITSKTRKIYFAGSKEGETEVLEVRLWNDTVANLTLMAMGSSAPEILLSVIEIVGRGFEAGELGPGTIVGSAAFNLLGICAICVMGIPKGETRRIRNFGVFLFTTSFSILAYLWLLFILKGTSPSKVDLWEALVTFLFFPVMVIVAWLVDRGTFSRKTSNVDGAIDKQFELGKFQPGESERMLSDRRFFKGGKLDREALVDFYKEVRKYPGLSDEDAAVLAASKLVETQPHTRMWYRIGAVRSISGGKPLHPKLSMKLREVYDVINAHPTAPDLGQLPTTDLHINAIIEFHAARCSVKEAIGKFPVAIVRKGRLDLPAKVKVETIEGTATSGEDFVAVNKIIEFGVGETRKEIEVEIVDDVQWEPDEEFFLRLSLVGGPEANPGVSLGRLPIMEITILNDDEPGMLTFSKRGLLVKESIGTVEIPVQRVNGADGVVSVKWRTADRTATMGKDYEGGEGELVFEHLETERVIEIPIIDDMDPEKDECFEVELFEAGGGAVLGPNTRVAITITSDDAFENVVDHVMSLTTASVEKLRVGQDTWATQLKNAMTVNGGDVQGASGMAYALHALTFFWKVLFGFLPPATLMGGWLCFISSLSAIGLLTAIIGDLASIFGCIVGLKDSVTAITFVALGTSLPDLFASKTAAIQEKYADNAVGNVTGSNSVNVFFGLGLPWLMATIYHSAKGTDFNVPSGDLGFSVMVYTIVAVVAIGVLMTRRFLPVFGQAELGGPVGPKIASGIVLLSLWFFYIALSTLKAYDVIKAEF